MFKLSLNTGLIVPQSLNIGNLEERLGKTAHTCWQNKKVIQMGLLR